MDSGGKGSNPTNYKHHNIHEIEKYILCNMVCECVVDCVSDYRMKKKSKNMHFSIWKK